MKHKPRKESKSEKSQYILPILIIVIISILVIIISITYLGYIQKITDENTLKNLGELTKQDATKIENQIKQHKKMLENVVEQIQRQETITSQGIFYIYENNIAKEEFSRIAIMYEDGTTITNDGEILNFSEEKEDFFSSDEILVSKSRKSKINQEEINIYSKKISINGTINQSEEKNIVILLVIETDQYENIFAASIYNGNAYEYIINSSGEIIANSKKRENGYNLFNILGTLNDKYNVQKLEKMKNQINEYQSGQVKYNVSWRYYYTSYQYLGVNDWYLVIITPGSIIAEEYNKTLIITLILLIILNAIIIVTVIYIVISNKKKKEKLYQLAYIDQLTGIGNKNYFFEKSIELLADNSFKYFLILIDIDKFKTFNKKYGREKGNVLLKYVSQKLKNILGEEQIITRLTDDLFAIMFKQRKVKVNENIVNIAEKIDRELSNIKIENIEYKIIISIGIYEIKQGESDIFQILDKALIAHRMAKGNYNKKYYIFNESLEKNMVKEHDIEMAMEEGIQKQEFKIFYQPKISSKTGKIEAAEALVRWEKNGVLIPPGEFISIFEKNKFIIKLDEYIYENVCKDIKEWENKYGQKMNVSVNVSKEHLMEKSFIENYCKIAEKYNLKPEDIELEITESAMIDDNFNMIKIFENMKKVGFKISIDDFGTGYSSLNMLQNMPIDIIKIDKSFINQTQMLEIIMMIVNKLKLKTVAEGVETSQQAQYLKALGVDLLQGYYYSKPLEKSEFEKYWENNS